MSHQTLIYLIEIQKAHKGIRRLKNKLRQVTEARDSWRQKYLILAQEYKDELNGESNEPTTIR